MTGSLYVLSKWIETQLETNKAALGLQDVFYGDQDRIPRTPAACVEPGEKRRELNGAPRRTMVTFVIYILVYHNPVKTVEAIRNDLTALAELIETLIHSDAQMGDNVIDSLVVQLEDGFLQRSNTLFRASRLTVEARQQVQLPSSA